eukprot:TRINITY_DN53730_c0_g1_i1.p1 TRINITY_DN53730_c0_g1~~TRINITY_DN53730_c0_g1_i1.p1  ORF type:complete len:181 (+),score=13.74 TRINITY_DN53730_c0_g1_i1:16-558(+)
MEHQMPILVVPKTARGYMRFVVVSNLEDGQNYTVGVAHVLDTKGGRRYTRALIQNIFTKRKIHVQGEICPCSVSNDSPCPFGTECPRIHVTQEGWQARRPWIRTPSAHSPEQTMIVHAHDRASGDQSNCKHAQANTEDSDSEVIFWQRFPAVYVRHRNPEKQRRLQTNEAKLSEANRGNS